jgi:hypothetical protein
MFNDDIYISSPPRLVSFAEISGRNVAKHGVSTQKSPVHTEKL